MNKLPSMNKIDQSATNAEALKNTNSLSASLKASPVDPDVMEYHIKSAKGFETPNVDSIARINIFIARYFEALKKQVQKNTDTNSNDIIAGCRKIEAEIQEIANSNGFSKEVLKVPLREVKEYVQKISMAA